MQNSIHYHLEETEKCEDEYLFHQHVIDDLNPDKIKYKLMRAQNSLETGGSNLPPLTHDTLAELSFKQRLFKAITMLTFNFMDDLKSKSSYPQLLTIFLKGHCSCVTVFI